MTNQTPMLNFARGTIPLNEVVEGKEIIKKITDNLNRVETLSVVSENKGYIATTEKFDEDLEFIRNYNLQKDKLIMINQRFHDLSSDKYYN